LIVRAPSLTPQRIREVVRLTDVMPTILDLLNLPGPPIDGVSLEDLMRGRGHNADLEAYSESVYPARLGWSPLFALRDGRFKLIDAPRPELYDLQDDPFEQRNIYDERGTLAKAMVGRIEVLKGTSRPEERAHVTDDLQARLSSLGYVGSAATPAVADRSALPDPKDCIGAFTPLSPHSRSIRSSSTLERSGSSNRSGPHRRRRAE
jgi:choline-sulfatase